MEILRDYGMGMDNTCCGAMACAECHVLLDREWAGRVPPPTEEEIEKLDELPLVFETSRLSCQIIWSDELDGLGLKLALEHDLEKSRRTFRTRSCANKRDDDGRANTSANSLRQRPRAGRSGVSRARSGWERDHRRARIAHDGAEAAALEAVGKAEVAKNTVVDVYLADVEIGADGAPTPVHYREKMRVKGPSVRARSWQAGVAVSSGEHKMTAHDPELSRRPNSPTTTYLYDEFDEAFVRERVAEFREQVRRRLDRRADRGGVPALPPDERPLSAASRLYAARRHPLWNADRAADAPARRHRRQMGQGLRPFHHAPEHSIQLAEARRHARIFWRRWPTSTCTPSRRRATASAM